MQFFKHIFSYDFLFYINRIQLERVDKIFLVVAGAALVGAVIVRLVAGRTKHVVRRKLLLKHWRLTLVFGLLGLLWFGMRYELVGWLGTHFAFLLLVVVAILWKARIAYYFFTKYRVEKAAWEHQQLKDKYLKMQN